MVTRRYAQWGAVTGVAIGGVIRLMAQSTVAGFVGGVVTGMILCWLIYAISSRAH
ncbi:MAG: hypothetical protein ACR2JW_19730 [Thermomicrobiales bacterium]